MNNNNNNNNNAGNHSRKSFLVRLIEPGTYTHGGAHTQYSGCQTDCQTAEAGSL
jgi:hypothetical protein